MVEMSANLAVLDALPPGCSVVVNVDVDGRRARFQAVAADGSLSRWSGWFPIVAGEPVRLSWVAFDFDSEVP